jgi:hypothetical protein
MFSTSAKLQLAAASLAATVLTSGCGLMVPNAERYEVPPLGSAWVTTRQDTGSYGSGSGEVNGRRGERMYQGAPVITFEAAGGTIIANQQGSWFGMFNGEAPVLTWDPPLHWQWPLEVGKSWTRKQSMTVYPAKRTISYDLTQKVEAYEDVTVPAGTFKAFKVSTKTSLGDDNLAWYSPEHGIFVKQSLKRTATHAQGAGTREIEMKSYKRAAQ